MPTSSQEVSRINFLCVSLSLSLRPREHDLQKCTLRAARELCWLSSPRPETSWPPYRLPPSGGVRMNMGERAQRTNVSASPLMPAGEHGSQKMHWTTMDAQCYTNNDSHSCHWPPRAGVTNAGAMVTRPNSELGSRYFCCPWRMYRCRCPTSSPHSTEPNSVSLRQCRLTSTRGQMDRLRLL